MARKRSIEIYLKPGVDEDDQIYDVWLALRERSRPQDVFRRMLRLGLRAMVETGELPRVALASVDVDLLVPTPPATAPTGRPRLQRPPPPLRAESPVAAPAPPVPAAPVAIPAPPAPAAPAVVAPAPPVPAAPVVAPPAPPAPAAPAAVAQLVRQTQQAPPPAANAAPAALSSQPARPKLGRIM